MQHHSRTEQHPPCAWNSKQLHYECKYPYILSFVLKIYLHKEIFFTIYTCLHLHVHLSLISSYQNLGKVTNSIVVYMYFNLRWVFIPQTCLKINESLKCRTNSPASWKLQIIHVQYSYLNIYHESDFFSLCISITLKLFLVICFWYMYTRNETLLDWLTS